MVEEVVWMKRKIVRKFESIKLESSIGFIYGEVC